MICTEENLTLSGIGDEEILQKSSGQCLIMCLHQSTVITYLSVYCYHDFISLLLSRLYQSTVITSLSIYCYHIFINLLLSRVFISLLLSHLYQSTVITS